MEMRGYKAKREAKKDLDGSGYEGIGSGKLVQMLWTVDSHAWKRKTVGDTCGLPLGFFPRQKGC